MNSVFFFKAFEGSLPVESGGFHHLAGRIGLGQEVVRTLAGRNESGQFFFQNYTGRFGSHRPDTTRPARGGLTSENCCFSCVRRKHTSLGREEGKVKDKMTWNKSWTRFAAGRG